MRTKIKRQITIDPRSNLTEQQYHDFLIESYADVWLLVPNFQIFDELFGFFEVFQLNYVVN